jgi:hypothetical protein
MKIFLFLLSLIFTTGNLSAQMPAEFAPAPPMGWNSWDCFGLEVNEEQVKATADFMAEHLLPFGWQYVVIDMGWYYTPAVKTNIGGMTSPPMNIDPYGRLIPDVTKFPSATDTLGFKPLADYIHSKGLKFGIHIMRGIPWKAASENTPVIGTDAHAKDVADYGNICAWSKAMVGLKMDMPASQAYYNSIFKLYADWGIDYIKVDDVAREFHDEDMLAITKAIQNSGRQMVLSLSPGPSPLSEADFFKEYANLYRISNDFWDHWKFVPQQMNYCEDWYEHITPGHWPDIDMLPFGKLRITGGDDWVASLLEDKYANIGDELSRFTDLEKQTIMSLWSIFRSPLMFGGYLPETDTFTISLISNEEVLYVNQHSTHNRLLKKETNTWIWTADKPDSDEKYLALFNLNKDSKNIWVDFSSLGIDKNSRVRNLWTGQEPGIFGPAMGVNIEGHGSRLYKITPTTEDITVGVSSVPGPACRIYPNPVTGHSSAIFMVDQEQMAEIGLFDEKGNYIARIFNGILSAGINNIPCNRSDLPGGMYFLKIKTAAGTQVQKLIIL